MTVEPIDPTAVDPPATQPIDVTSLIEDALAKAYGASVESIGSGASIPLVALLKKVAPGAAIVLWGVEDTEKSRIHASDESVDPGEIERMIVAQTLFVQEFAASAPIK